MLPLLPVATLVFGFGLLEVTSEPPMGLVTLHEMLMLHVLAPDGMVHDEGESESVPDGAAAWHELPFHEVPDAQLAVAVLLASSWVLL